MMITVTACGKYKGQAIPLQAWTGPLGILEVEAPRISSNLAQKNGEVFSPMHWPPVPFRDMPGTHFCWMLYACGTGW